MIFPSFGGNQRLLRISTNFDPIRFALIGLSTFNMVSSNTELKIKFEVDTDRILEATPGA